MIDEDETVMPVNVYNLAQGSGVKIGDSVAIPEPYVQHVSVKHKDKVWGLFCFYFKYYLYASAVLIAFCSLLYVQRVKRQLKSVFADFVDKVFAMYILYRINI